MTKDQELAANEQERSEQWFQSDNEKRTQRQMTMHALEEDIMHGQAAQDFDPDQSKTIIDWNVEAYYRASDWGPYGVLEQFDIIYGSRFLSLVLQGAADESSVS